MTGEGTDEEPTVEEILDTIGDPRARKILAALSQKPRPVNELESNLGYARSTLYRRLDDLQKHDLVTSETAIAEDGNHYQLFRCNFDSTLISLNGDEYDVRIYRKENLPDRFDRLWNELGSD